MSRDDHETSVSDKPRAQTRMQTRMQTRTQTLPQTRTQMAAMRERPLARASVNEGRSGGAHPAPSAVARGLCAPERRSAGCSGAADCPGPGASCGSHAGGRAVPVLLRRDP